MQILNFQIDTGFTSLIFQGEYFDLHNSFEFQRSSFDAIKRSAEWIFRKGVGDWIPENGPDTLKLRFENVREHYQKAHPADYPEGHLDADARIIDMIGFTYAGDEIVDGVTDNIPGSHLPGMLLVFITGMADKIVADSLALFADRTTIRATRN